MTSSHAELLQQMTDFAAWTSTNGYTFLPEIACKETATCIEISWIVLPGQRVPWLPSEYHDVGEYVFEVLQYDKNANTFSLKRDGKEVTATNENIEHQYLNVLTTLFQWKFLRDPEQLSGVFNHPFTTRGSRPSTLKNLWRWYPDTTSGLLNRSEVLTIDDAIKSMRATLELISLNFFQPTDAPTKIWDSLATHLVLNSRENFRNYCNIFWTYAFEWFSPEPGIVKWTYGNTSFNPLNGDDESRFWKKYTSEKISLLFSFACDPQNIQNAHTFPLGNVDILNAPPNTPRIPFYVRTSNTIEHRNVYYENENNCNPTIEDCCSILENILSPVDLQQLWKDRYEAIIGQPLLPEEAFFALQWCLIHHDLAPPTMKEEWTTTKNVIESLLNWKYTRHVEQATCCMEAMQLVKTRHTLESSPIVELPNLEGSYNI